MKELGLSWGRCGGKAWPSRELHLQSQVETRQYGAGSDFPSVNRSIGSDPAACMAWSCHVVLAQNELFLSDLRGWKDEARLLSILREAP